ncbi:MAG: VCBS repeat-containing protein [bacterium]|nr:VCBS repeat-containing protein [bacterium]
MLPTPRAVRQSPSVHGLMAWGGVFLVVLATASGPAGAGGNGTFSDQTAASQVVASYSGSDVHSFHGGGVVGDFNGDGWQDIFFPGGGGSGDKLFINDGGGTFTEARTVS